MPTTNPNNPKKIRIIQINLNKSEKAHFDLINNKLTNDWDIVLAQEPHTTFFQAIRSPPNFRPVFPTDRGRNAQVRSVIWVNTRLDTKYWKIIDIPDTNDITAIQLRGPYGRLTIFNIYNDCTHSNSEKIIRSTIREKVGEIRKEANDHMIWAGDFNRHHPLWDRDEDTHLFTPAATRKADGLINLLAEFDMEMKLPKGTPTLQHMRSKRYSRPDNVFCTTRLSNMVTRCEVDPKNRPPCTDHFPIATEISLPQERTTEAPSYNFREVDWTDFRKNLEARLKDLNAPQPLTTEIQFQKAAKDLTEAIQDTIRTRVKIRRPRPDSKRWWNSDLKKMKKELNKLRVESFRNRALTDHPIHRDVRRLSNKYGTEILKAKRQHWTDFLEEATVDDIWTANRYFKEPSGDGGRPRIPTLQVNQGGNTTNINDNEEKATIFAKTFFPTRPTNSSVPTRYVYPEPIPTPRGITKKQILDQILRLSPYKASGHDEIPNVVLQRCADLILDYLFHILQGTLERGYYYKPWRESITVVLCKPGKPNYSVPKAYRPIALLCTIAKLLTAIIADEVSRLAKKHQLLPKTHFGGRPGRTTTDAIHYLVHKVKEAWRKGKVASILFLDVEGAFPNAVTDRLIHNLKKRRIPTAYVKFIIQLLKDRMTKLKFDDFISEPIKIENGIGQGDPLSMILYIFYNADLLEITDTNNKEDVIGYVDDIAMIVTGSDFNETTGKLRHLMTRIDGGISWSKEHNSTFEMSKSVVMHISRRTQADPQNTRKRTPLSHPPLRINGQEIQEVTNFKYLGILLDEGLKWKAQSQKAIANATKWILQFRRLTKPYTGVSAKLMRQLYIAVAIPKMTYGAEVWYTPPIKPTGAARNAGSVGALKGLQKTHRVAILAINGALRTTPTDLLDAHAGTLPIELTLLKVCHCKGTLQPPSVSLPPASATSITLPLIIRLCHLLRGILN